VTDDRELAERLTGLGSATLGESGGLPLPNTLSPVWLGATVAAPAYPVSCAAGDNLAIHAAVAAAPAGRALVVGVPGDRDHGFWGEVLTVAAQARGLAGLVIEACVRDVDALAARRFAVFATGVALPGASKSGPGAIGRPIVIGGVEVHDGDWVVADADGVVVLPADRCHEILAAGDQRARREATMFEQLADGRTTVELLDLDVSTIEPPTAR
jgi:4-hydroxy-4-methyl-2-oxoglutarate aldolase